VHPSGAVTTWKSLPRTVWRRNLIALLSSIASIFFFIVEIVLVKSQFFNRNKFNGPKAHTGIGTNDIGTYNYNASMEGTIQPLVILLNAEYRKLR
jgi:hypothetical protein